MMNQEAPLHSLTIRNTDMKRVNINNFSGGMTNDPRNSESNKARNIQHFDVFTRPHALIPLRSYENGDSSSANFKIANFVYYQGVFYGLGVRTSAFTNACIYSNTDFTGSTWTDISFANAGSTRVLADVAAFAAYHGNLYGVVNARYVWRFQLSDFSQHNTEQDLTAYTNVSNMAVHPTDDILYLGYDNKIAANNAGSWTPAALTLPQDYIITSLRPYGNFLAIGMRPSSGENSRMFLWDRDSSVATLAETVDWGEGDLMALEELGGALIGISKLNSANYFTSSIVVRHYTSAGAEKILQLDSVTSTGSAGLFSRKVNGRILIPVSLNLDGANSIYAIAAIGRQYAGGPFAITLERLQTNDSTVSPGVNVQLGFYLIGSYLFNSYIDNSSAYHMSKTDDQANYTAVSVYETSINQGMDAADRILDKKLHSVGATYEPLPAAGQVVVKYRVNGGSWITIFTETTDGATRTEPYTVDANGNAFTDSSEYEFRIESTGGAILTGFNYRYETKQSN